MSGKGVFMSDISQDLLTEIEIFKNGYKKIIETSSPQVLLQKIDQAIYYFLKHVEEITHK